MLLAAPNEPAWVALRAQLHRDRRQATCVEDAIVGPELNSGEGRNDPEGEWSNLHSLSCSIASCGGRGLIVPSSAEWTHCMQFVGHSRSNQEQVSESLRGIGNNELHEVKGIFDSRASIF